MTTTHDRIKAMIDDLQAAKAAQAQLAQQQAIANAAQIAVDKMKADQQAVNRPLTYEEQLLANKNAQKGVK